MDFSKVKKSPIILKEENTGFARDAGKEIHGYIRIESSGNMAVITAAMENVRFFPGGEYEYKLIFAGTRKEKRRYHMLGTMSLSPTGRGEGSFRIDPENTDGSGMPLWEFSAVIIAAMSTTNPRESLHPVLKGTFSIEREKPQPSPSPKDYTPFYNRFVMENCITIAKEEKLFEDIVPFEKGPSGCRWKKITDSRLFPMIAPGAAEPMEKYGHFLFGWTDSHYMLAVPGRFFPAEQPDSGKSGFTLWLPIIGMEQESRNSALSIDEQRKNIYGYWIASINRYNGHIEEFPLIEQ